MGWRGHIMHTKYAKEMSFKIYNPSCLSICIGASTWEWSSQTLSCEVGVFGYQQWLKSEPGGYVFRERNSKTGKWPVIETIPEIPKPTLDQSACWCQVRYYSSINISFHWWFVMWHMQWSSEFQSVHGQLLSPSSLVWKHWARVTMWLGAHMDWHWRTGWDKPTQPNHRQYF